MRTRGKIRPEPLYLALSASYTFFLNIIIAVNLVYQVQDAGLGPLQLVLVGTALEATTFLFEVPTGVVADVVSRRLSVIAGCLLLGAGFILTGAFPHFETILAAQFVTGIGFTFISGAREAWVADEVGREHAGRVFLRAAQSEQVARVLGIPAGIGLGLLDLALPLVAGGALLMSLGAVLALVMPETGFRPLRQEDRAAWRTATGTFTAGARLVRGNPLLMTVFLITALYGAASEGFDRLWTPHFFHNLGFPGFGDVEPVFWFGVIRMGSAFIGIFFIEVVRRRIDTNSHAVVSRGLLAINSLMVLSLVAFALAGSFWQGMLLFWSIQVLSRVFDPLYLGWINQNVSDSQVRATVISMTSQTDALGQIAGGPVIGAIGEWVSLRAALAASAVALSPALGLYLRAIGQGPRGTPAGAPADG